MGNGHSCPDGYAERAARMLANSTSDGVTNLLRQLHVRSLRPSSFKYSHIPHADVITAGAAPKLNSGRGQRLMCRVAAPEKTEAVTEKTFVLRHGAEVKVRFRVQG